MSRSIAVPIVACLLLAAGAPPAPAADWIRPDYSAAAPQRFRQVDIFGETAKHAPLIYRTEVDVPDGCDRVTAMLRTTEWSYVWVDGRLVSADAGDDTTDIEIARRLRNRLQWLDLGEQLTPGRHVLAVSAAQEGFALDGGFYAGAQLLGKLQSHDGWSVTRFAPGTVVADHAIMTFDYDGAAEPKLCGPATDVMAVDAWHAREDALAAAHFGQSAARLRQKLADIRWRLDLMASKGLYIVDHEATGWGGPGRIRPDLAAGAATMLAEIPPLAERLTRLAAANIRSVDELKKILPDFRQVFLDVERMAAWLAQATAAAETADWAVARALIEQSSVEVPRIDAADPKQWARRYGLRRRLPLSPLNVSRYDPYGWLPLVELSDGDLTRWGVRVNPVPDPGRAAAERPWLFRTDPADSGVNESRWRMDYPTDEGWTEVTLGHDWSRCEDPRIAAFTGVAWYRGRIRIPATWAGMPIELKLTVSGDEQVWINGREVTSLGAGFRKRTYSIPADAVVYGGVNILAVRIDAAGAERGLTGEVTAGCPALNRPAEQDAPPVDVLATPLSPCVVLTPRTDLLRIYHGGKAALALPRSGRMEPATAYATAADGQLAANWTLLWLTPPTPDDVRRPILLVFEACPVEIRCSRGLTEVKLDRPGRRIVAVRPWARRNLSTAAGEVDLAERIRFWSRASRAVPINYVCLTDILPHGTWGAPQVDQVVLYGYLETTDQWDTPPLKIAPLPAPACLGLDCGAALEVADAEQMQVLQDGGIAAAYRGFVGRTEIRYRYPARTSRYVGFTYRKPSSTTSLKEVRLLASLGANSLRWRHRWDDQLATQPPPPASRPAGRNQPPTPEELTRAVGLRYVHSLVDDPQRAADRTGRGYELFAEAVGRYYRMTAARLGARDASLVGYELLDAPVHYPRQPYDRAIRRITEQIRSVDDEHTIFVQPCAAEAGPAGLALLEPTGDGRTVYGFRDDRFTVHGPADRWPRADADISDIARHWWPAIAFGIRHGVDLHCTGFGNFPTRLTDTHEQRLLLNDMLRLIGQFGMHSHFDSAEDLFVLQADGAVQPTHAAEAYRAYLQGPWVDPPYRKATRTPSQP